MLLLVLIRMASKQTERKLLPLISNESVLAIERCSAGAEELYRLVAGPLTEPVLDGVIRRHNFQPAVERITVAAATLTAPWMS